MSLKEIEQLRREVHWSKADLQAKITDWAGQDNVDLKSLSRELLKELFQYLITVAPFVIYLDNLEDRDGCVMIECESQVLAKHDQSIAGSNWEFPRDLDIAYASPIDHPRLVEQLRSEGYIVNTDDYVQPHTAQAN